MSPDEPAAETAAGAPEPSAGASPPAAAETTSPAADAAPKKGHRGRNITLVLLAVLVVAAVAALVWGLSDTTAKDYPELVSAQTLQDNTAATAALMNLGIDSPAASVAGGTVTASYDLRRSPANATWHAANGGTGEPIAADDLQRAAIGAMVEAVPDATSLAIEQTDGGVHRTTWTVAVADVLAFFAGDLTVEQFEAKIAKS